MLGTTVNITPNISIPLGNCSMLFFLRDEFGFIAFVFVIEKYRKKGLGSALIRHLSQKIIEGGGCPYAYIVIGNDASCRMFENVGFHRLEEKYTFIGFSY